MKTDGEMSLAITRRDGSVTGGEEPPRNISQRLISREFSLSANFLTLFISRRGAKIHSVVIIYYRRAAAAAARESFLPRGWRAIIANNKRESHLIIMIVQLLSVAPSNNFVSR